MNVLALEATLCFCGIFAKELCKATLLLKNFQVRGHRNTLSQTYSSENRAVHNYDKCDRKRGQGNI
jgi:hypothetical protein